MWTWKPLILLVVALLGFFIWRNPNEKPPVESYPQSWHIPRTIKTTNGKVWQNVTIRALSRDGGVIVNHGANTIKIPGGLMDPEAMAIIVKTAPASGSSVARESPYTINPHTLRPPQRARIWTARETATER